MSGLTQTEAEMRLLNEIPFQAPARPQPQAETLPAPVPATPGSGVCLRRAAAAPRCASGVPVPGSVGEGRSPRAPPAPALSRTAVDAPIKIFLPPFSQAFTFTFILVVVGERRCRWFEGFFLNGPIFILCPQFSVQHSIVKFFW